eukprot:c233_g1_i2.p1 GENE.c233_g1_i2~~c233_g1_i2.p1  ORF type:complete len:319 (+),score=63.66 c233_g1_i2:36-992(+)
MKSFLARHSYVFDVSGFTVVKGLLSAQEVAACNSAINLHRHQFRERLEALRNSKLSAFAGDGATGRLDCGQMLYWDKPHSNVFRSLIAHKKVIPLLNEFLGDGFRLDHLPLCIIQRKGCEGFDFHGGAVGPNGTWDESIDYTVKSNTIRTKLINVSIALSDTINHNDPSNPLGGFAIVPGSHKANFEMPEEIAQLETGIIPGLIHIPQVRAGDAILFTEATAHGALPWNGDIERRTLFYRFAPPTSGYGRGYTYNFPKEFLDELDEAQRSVLEPPYHPRLNRVCVKVGESGDLQTYIKYPRSGPKREFDHSVFGKDYF